MIPTQECSESGGPCAGLMGALLPLLHRCSMGAGAATPCRGGWGGVGWKGGGVGARGGGQRVVGDAKRGCETRTARPHSERSWCCMLLKQIKAAYSDPPWLP